MSDDLDPARGAIYGFFLGGLIWMIIAVLAYLIYWIASTVL